MSQFVKKQDIVAEYSKLVATMASKGTVFTPTMNGSQGEEAHVDFITPDHKTVYRVLLYDQCGYGRGYERAEVIEVRGYDANDLGVPNLDVLYEQSFRANIWNDKGVQIMERRFYGQRQGNSDKVTTYTEDKQVVEQAYERMKYKCANGFYEHQGIGPKTVRINHVKVAQFVRAHGGRGYGRVKAEDIDQVLKYYTNDGKVRYTVKFVSPSKKDLVW